MTHQTLVDELTTLRRSLDRLNADPWSPAVERSLRLADMYLHLALWQLGEVELTPELATDGPQGEARSSTSAA
jgi:hypothetical protein